MPPHAALAQLKPTEKTPDERHRLFVIGADEGLAGRLPSQPQPIDPQRKRCCGKNRLISRLIFRR
jgi:hypothetical protein